MRVLLVDDQARFPQSPAIALSDLPPVEQPANVTSID